MTDTDSLAPLLSAISAATEWLESCGVQAAIVGGVAASLHGRPRVTKDIDFVALADLEDCERLIEEAAGFGIVARAADAADFARTTRVLLLRHAASGVEIDLSFGALAFEHELVSKSELASVGGVRFRLAGPEDVIIMKALALRPRDVADIAAIAEANPGLDLDRVRATVEEFAAALEEGDLVAELDRVLSAVRRSRS